MKPLLLTKEICRANNLNNREWTFEYDYQTDMNMINSQPYIEVAMWRETELFTKTREYRERDDEEVYHSINSIPDIKNRVNLAYEMLTKTFTQRERDDEDDFNYYE